MTKARFAAIQMTAGIDPDANLRVAEELIGKAADAGAQLVVLPENFAAMGASEADRCELAEPDGDGPLQAFLAAQSARRGVWVVGGTIPIVSDDPQRPYASTLVFSADGARVARYDKIHLFDVGLPGRDESYRESAHTRAGSTPLTFTTPWGEICVAVCYDLRFPELFRQFSAPGPDFIVLPAAFTELTGQAHWSILLRSRAIENQCFVVAAAQSGAHENGRRTYGHSIIVGPWGQVMAGAGTEPGFIFADLDLAEQAEIRKRFPTWDHRKL